MEEVYKKYGPLAIVLTILYFSLIIIKPFIYHIILAMVVAYIFYPINKFIFEKSGKKNFTAIFMTLTVIILVVLPFFFILNSLIKQIPVAYSHLGDALSNSRIWTEYINLRLIDYGVEIDLSQIIQNISAYFLNIAKGIITSLPSKVLSLVMFLIFLFFSFRDGKNMLEKLKIYLPFSKTKTHIIFLEAKKMLDALVYGQIITAFIQSILAMLIYTIIGVKAPIFWGILTLMFAMIPMIGPAIVYTPLSIGIFAAGYFASDTIGMIKGVILLVFGVAIISTVDNVVKPILISDKISFHPSLIFVGVFGGVAVFGMTGIILGPMILTLLTTFFNIYENQSKLF